MSGSQEAAAPTTPQGASTGFDDEVKEFSSHCAYIRTVFTLTLRIWRDSTDDERRMMERISPSFFLDMGQVLAEYVVRAACRITDPANNGKNFTIEYYVTASRRTRQHSNSSNNSSRSCTSCETAHSTSAARRRPDGRRPRFRSHDQRQPPTGPAPAHEREHSSSFPPLEHLATRTPVQGQPTVPRHWENATFGQ